MIGSTVVWLAALPLVASRFHIVSLIGILLNIPLIPLTTAAMLLSGLGLVLSAVWGPLGTLPAWGAGWLLKLTEAIVFWGVARRWGHSFVIGPAWEWVLVFYILLTLAAVSAFLAAGQSRSLGTGWLKRSLAWWLLAAWFIPGWLMSGMSMTADAPSAEFLAVGHGLAVLIQTPSGQSFLYDCGALGDPTIGRRVIAQALWARGVTRIDTVILSHADKDHYGALPDLLDRFQIGAVRIPPGFAGLSNPGATRLIDQVESRGIRVLPTTAPASWESAGVRFTVQHPPADWHPESSDNARSLVLDIAHSSRHLVLTGDLEHQGLEALVDRPRPEPPPDVFLSPHHGGKSANPDWLYQWAKPRLVVVSQRPPVSRTGDALARVEEQGIPLLRTWRQGAIRLHWTDTGIVAQSLLEENARPSQNGSPLELMGQFWSSLVSIHYLWMILHYLAGLVGFVLGLMACLVLAVVEFVAWALVVPPRSIKHEDNSTFGPASADPASPAESITVRARNGALLAGRWFPTARPGGLGRTVLLLHGFAEGSSALEPRRVATLNRHGWNVAALDSRGYGQSEGPYASFGGHEAEDIRTWLDLLAKRMALAEPESLFRPALWGRSMGAAIAMRAAALDTRIVALVLESPMVDLDDSLASTLRRRRIPFPGLMARLVLARGKLAGVPLNRPRPIDLALRLTCPTLIIHGTDDTLVTIDDARTGRRVSHSTPLVRRRRHGPH